MICAFLGSAMSVANARPKYLVCDRDSIFDCPAFRRWVKRKEIKPPRYGAVGKHGSIAVVERLIGTLKVEATRRMIVPMRRHQIRNELKLFTSWYNEYRPHTTLNGCAPNEVYFGRCPTNRKPRIEPRARWPRRLKCAQPQTLVAGRPGDRFNLKRLLPRWPSSSAHRDFEACCLTALSILGAAVSLRATMVVTPIFVN